MNKNYFKTLLSAFVMALCATSANADVQSMTDLFGKYKFTADVEVLDKEYEETFKNECEVTIATGLNIYVPASIVGIGGGTETQTINKFDATAHTFTCINPNTPSPWGDGLFYSNVEGQNPYGEIQRTLEIVYTFDPATKEISMEDFTVVTLSQQNESGTATIVAKFTNVKLTLEESEEIGIADLSDVWTFKGSPEKENDAYPSTFTLTLESTSEDFKNYNAKLAFEGYDTITTTATFDGIELSMPYDSICVNSEDSIFLVTYWAPKTKGNFTFTYNIEAANLSLSSGIDFAKRTVTENAEGKKIVEFNSQHSFINGTLVRPSSEDAYDWAGTYTVKGDVMLNDGVTKDYPEEFTFVVEYHEQWQMYLVTEFMGNDVTSVNQGGITFTVAEGGKSATIKAGAYIEYNYEEDADWNPTSITATLLKDINGQDNPITLTLNEDGTLSMSAFSIFYADLLAGTDPVFEAMYQDNAVTKDGGETEEEFDWTGTYTVNGDVMVNDGITKEYPEEFTFVVEYKEQWQMYLVTEFMGNDVTSVNQGGITFTIAEDGKSATIKAGTYIEYNYEEDADWNPTSITATLLKDMNGQDSPITLTLNEDGTLSMSAFSIFYADLLAGTDPVFEAMYQDNVVTKEAKEDDSESDVEEFDWTGTFIVNGEVSLNDGVNKDYPEEFTFVVEYNEQWQMYLVTKFMGNDVTSVNQGGITFTIAEDGKSATIKTGAYIEYNYEEDADWNPTSITATLLKDINGQDSPITLTLNEDGTLSMSDFSIFYSDLLAGTDPVFEAMYKNNVVTKGEDDPETGIDAPVASETINLNSNQKVSVYDTAGRKVYTGAANAVNSLPKGLYIVKSASAVVKLNIR